MNPVSVSDPLRLLVVESEASDRGGLADSLATTATDVDVTSVGSAEEASSHLDSTSVDAVVCATSDGWRSIQEVIEHVSEATPVFGFAGEPPADDAATDGGNVEWIDATSGNAVELLAARAEARCATERVRTLSESVAVALEATATGLVRTDPDGRIVDVSGQLPAAVGRNRDDLVESSWASLFASLPAAATAVLRSDRESWSGRLELSTADGDRIPRDCTVVSMTNGGITCVVHGEPGPSTHDTLLTEQSMLDSLMERLPMSIYFKDAEARHVKVSQNQVNPPTETHDGEVLTDPEQFIGKTDLDIYEPGLARESYEDDLHVIETGEPIIGKVEHTEQFGEDMWSLTSKVPWTDQDGEICGLVGGTLDVTAEKTHEQEIERQRERLEEFASVVTHDLRNPLSVAQGYLTVTKESGDEDALEEIEYSLDRMEQIIRDVLALARQGEAVGERVIVSLQSIVEEAWEQVATGDATLEQRGELRFRADQSRLLQLVENLIRNAIEHGGEDVTITVEPLGRGRGFAIEDDGPGIPPDEREEVFESGYTTTTVGTGFGLAIVEQIVEAHDWSIELTEGADGGARFEITGVGDDFSA